jgi:hypothetical protein
MWLRIGEEESKQRINGTFKIDCKRVWLEGDENLLDGKMVK